jgi:hypothetical protein
MMLSVFSGSLLQLLKAMMGSLVAGPDTLSQNLHVLVALVAGVLVILLCLGRAPACHE